MRQSRRMPRGIALCSAVALLGITIAISAGGRDVRAATGSSTGQVSGTGTIVVGGLTKTVSVLAGFDGVTPPTGSFSIATSSGGPPPTPSGGTVTCLFLTGTAVVLGVLMPGAPDLYGFIFISDGGPTGPDTLEIGDLAPGTFGVDCTVGPFGGAGGTLLTSGDFTVSPGQVDLIPADGIVDWLQPSGAAAGSFIDTSTTPSTTGSIVSTAGLPLTITDAPFPGGVVVSVGSGPAAPSGVPQASGGPVASPVPSPQAELFACGQTVLVDAGSVITLTCGSLIVTVTAGQATIVLGGGTTLVTIDPGGAVEVTDTGGGSFIVENLGTVPVTLTVDGTPTQVDPGVTATADTAHFVGFAQPVDNAPILNRVKAGQAIPIRWRLVDGAGAPITNLSSASIKVETLACRLGTTTDQVEEAVAGSSGLQNFGNGYYQLNWKSPTTYANSCKTLHLQLGGVTHDALFQFTK